MRSGVTGMGRVAEFFTGLQLVYTAWLDARVRSVRGGFGRREDEQRHGGSGKLAVQ